MTTVAGPPLYWPTVAMVKISPKAVVDTKFYRAAGGIAPIDSSDGEALAAPSLQTLALSLTPFETANEPGLV